MNHRKWYLLASAAWAILTSGYATPLSDTDESRNLTLDRSPRSLFTQKDMEESLRSCLVQSGFSNVNCNTDSGYVRCLAGGFKHSPIIGNSIATLVGVAVGAICIAVIGCCCWALSGKLKERAAAALQMLQAARVPPSQGCTVIESVNPTATTANIGSGFPRH